jgi:hypothetical protein
MNERPLVEAPHGESQMWHVMDREAGGMCGNETIHGTQRSRQIEANDYNNNEVDQGNDAGFHSELEIDLDRKSRRPGAPSQIRREDYSEQRIWEFVNF